MMGSFLTRGLVMIFGYAYPAYECYKTVEKNKPEIEQLRFWCQYWILVAALTVFERVGDTFISWVPMYSEAKVAFFIYLWYPKTKGTSYVYSSFFQPYLAKHETEIDRNLLELRTRAGDIAVLYWQRAASYGQTRIFEILHYVSAQSTPRPRHTQQQQQGAEIRQPPPPPAVPTRQPTATVKQQPQPPTRTKSKSTTQHQIEPAQEAVPPATPAPPAALDAQTTVAGQPTTEATSTESTQSEAETMQIEPASSLANGNANQPPKETVMEEAIRMTRGRLRKTRAATKR